MKRLVAIASVFLTMLLLALFLWPENSSIQRESESRISPTAAQTTIASEQPPTFDNNYVTIVGDAPALPLSRKSFWEEQANVNVLEMGEYVYDTQWKEFVNSLELAPPVRAQVRDILIRSEAHNTEIGELLAAGEITEEGHNDAWLTYSEIAEALGSVLSTEQVEIYLRTAETTADAFMQELVEFQSNQLANGIVGILGAASRNDLASTQAYIDSGANVDMTSLDGSNTPLLYAVMNGNLEMARTLIQAGADVDLSTADGFQSTALVTAADFGNAEMIHLLAEAGADLDAGPEESMNALQSAAFGSYTDAVAALLEAGADATGRAGSRALEYAVMHDDATMERLLIQSGAQETRAVRSARQEQVRRKQ